MRDFDQLWHNGLPSGEVPFDDEELKRRIRQVQWRISAKPAPRRRSTHGVGRGWSVAASVAVVVAVCVGMLYPRDGVPKVRVDGQRISFVCNDGCSPVATVRRMDELIINR